MPPPHCSPAGGRGAAGPADGGVAGAVGAAGSPGGGAADVDAAASLDGGKQGSGCDGGTRQGVAIWLSVL
ncbi:hypothetical protein I4F81_010633 [Pyropia yezoensis]|uniref:Uncharacterized protein n=1 Tax=Pyropia yezoensis TaxID=2788 RepID=A0ACC3CE59_PYRYE|nr:hypothetical protein I4F81_010633 [Neopyropia yezoensis]